MDRLGESAPATYVIPDKPDHQMALSRCFNNIYRRDTLTESLIMECNAN